MREIGASAVDVDGGLRVRVRSRVDVGCVECGCVSGVGGYEDFESYGCGCG